jgi:lysozyme family protein
LKKLKGNKMADFEPAFEYVFRNETLEDNPDKVISDGGGLTKYGISLNFLRAIPLERLATYSIYSNEPDDIINLKVAQAKELYRGEFWDNAPFGAIDSQKNCNYIFDMAVNLGIAPAIKCAQRAIWSIFHKRQILIDDGILGGETLDLINQSGFFLLPVMRSERASYYRMIVEHNPAQKSSLNGWLNRAYGG